MKKSTTLTLGSLAALAAANNAEAAIVYFDVNPDQTISDGGFAMFGEINLGSGTYTYGSTSSPEFALFFNIGGTNLYNGFGNQSVEWGLGGGSFVPNLTYGSTIDSLAITSWSNGYGYLVQGGSGYWVGGANAYAPLRINQGGGNYNYGWVAINYDTLGPTATITGFAFEDQVNTTILAGATVSAAVPEPGQVAASLLLLTGIAGYLAYRRRIGAATEPDALHTLALGSRGIADFRADKAA